MARKNKGGKKRGQSKQATLKVVPIQGSSTESAIALGKGTTVQQALEAAGVSAERKNLSVNGKSAQLDQKLSPGDTLQVEERPQGS
jgi:sulfur carrier protein ThiS